MGQRIEWLDSLKFFLIYSVLLGHVFTTYKSVGIDPFDNFLCRGIYIFHMPLFMILSGHFSKKIYNGLSYIKDRIMQLLVPTFVFYSICYILGWQGHNVWFLPCLLICNLLIYIYIYIFENTLGLQRYRCIILPLLLLIGIPLFIHIPFISQYKVGFMLPFFSIGLWLDISKLFNKRLTICLGILFLFILQFYKKDYLWYYSPESWLNYKDIVNGNLAFNVENFSCFFVRIIAGFVGSCFIISLFGILSKFPKVLLGKNIGKYTLQIYLIQTLLLEHNFAHYHLSANFTWWFTVIVAPIIAFVFILLCLCIIKLVEKVKWLDILCFGNYKKYYK